MTDAFTTLRNLPPHLQTHRFWIWVQIVVLTFFVRHVRRDARQMLVQITSSGAVHIAVIGDMPGTAKADPLSFAPSRAFLAAMSGFEPERGGICSPRTHSRPGIEICVPSIPDSGRDRNEQTSVSLPLPET
ncbi:MAG TPA: hypothetical protein DCR96_10165 [Hyphomonas sp.]|uniref:hypothetical protein n=1 Tax=unclassified Hyphomonas TaxID=2630699 RepID=UPI000E7E10DB|nr:MULTISPECIES: hypothetical protein [unclassified Hyphomonas]HAQ76844.1 hypothetical protein [Hyphomonas sp.]|tara:strand:- start:12718 stop:13110 length:393 start_codon:yes stop_codon:yes gene_type:complete